MLGGGPAGRPTGRGEGPAAGWRRSPARVRARPGEGGAAGAGGGDPWLRVAPVGSARLGSALLRLRARLLCSAGFPACE